jgi:hypothetical protein
MGNEAEGTIPSLTAKSSKIAHYEPLSKKLAATPDVKMRVVCHVFRRGSPSLK